VTHILETLLDRIRKGEMALTADQVDAFLVSKDVLSMLMDGHHHGSGVDQAAVDSICERLKALSQGVAPAASPAPVMAAPEPAKPAAEPVADANGDFVYRIELPEVPQKDVDALAAELGLLGTIEQEVLADKRVAFSLTTCESQDNIVAICSFVLDPDDLKISHGGAQAPAPAEAESTQQAGDVGYEIFEPVKTETAQPAPAAAAAVAPPPASAPAAEARNFGRRATDKEGSGQESSSIRVGVEKVDQLINLVGELVITQAMIEQRIAALDPMLHERLLNSAGQLARNTRDLQEAVMSIRMMPMDYVFSRFPRMVRDLA
jgi:two-component system chemotaxis sensor kinase CheA